MSIPAASGWTLLGSPRPQGFRHYSVQAFIHQYVQKSVKGRIVLGPAKRTMVRTLNSALPLTVSLRFGGGSLQRPISRSSVASGERCRGREKYQEADRPFLRWEQEGENVRDRPIKLSRYWILLKPSSKLNLGINSLYVKVEATAADIIVILLTLYQRAEDIPATPLTRISFHVALLLGSTGFPSG
ncbi:hypothetical protein V8F06_014755 [Rhypophila decipiens]